METTSAPATIVTEAAASIDSAAARISDPIERARAIEDAGANIPLLQHRIRVARAAAIREAIAARSATSVAAELGISRSRLYKILEGH